MADGNEPTTPPSDGVSTAPRNAEERRALLARALQTQVVEGGRIESQSDYSAVVVQGHRVNHVLHLVLTLITSGSGVSSGSLSSSLAGRSAGW